MLFSSTASVLMFRSCFQSRPLNFKLFFLISVILLITGKIPLGIIHKKTKGDTRKGNASPQLFTKMFFAKALFVWKRKEMLRSVLFSNLCLLFVFRIGNARRTLNEDFQISKRKHCQRCLVTSDFEVPFTFCWQMLKNLNCKVPLLLLTFHCRFPMEATHPRTIRHLNF